MEPVHTPEQLKKSDTKPIYITDEAADKIWEIDQMTGLKEGEKSLLMAEILKPFVEEQDPEALSE
jgi:hypothetical protein